MVELNSITKHFKKGKPHHTVVQFADDGKFWEYTVPAKERFKVFSDERFILIEDYCIPFPEECDRMAYMGLSGSSVIFRSRAEKQKIVTISPAIPQPIIEIENFSSHLRHGEDSKHPVIRKLLEVNNAKEIHILNGIREEGTKGSRMFAVDHNDKVSEIEFEVLVERGGIDRLLQAKEPLRGYDYIYDNAVLSIHERDEIFLAEINPFEYQRRINNLGEKLIVCGPNDVVKSGVLRWQAI